MFDKVDLLIKNAMVYNSYYKEFNKANVAILGKKFFYVDDTFQISSECDKVIDASGKYMIPGLVDIHMHIESSMVSPGPFCNHLASCGVTTIVSEPHEIANVEGIAGIEEMIRAGNESVIDVYYGIPSSVPSTNEELETTGGKIDFEDMKYLMGIDKIVCVGEVMNYREVIRENNLEISKFLKYLNENFPTYIIEGHCPSLVGLDLAKFLYLGIDADHTEHTLEEIIERFKNGMFVELQHKTLKEEIFEHIIENNLFEHCCFVTDDVMADELLNKGHLDNVVREAISKGFPIEEAIYCSTFTPSRRMNLRDRGVIAPGKLADFILLNELDTLEINQVYKNGQIIYDKEIENNYINENHTFPESFYNSVKLNKITADDLKVLIDNKSSQVKVRVMDIKDGTTRISEKKAILEVKDGVLQWENTDYILGVVLERYGKNFNKSFAILSGDGIKEGAVATTWSHDHHNLLAIGKDVESLLVVINTIIEQQGGFVVANVGKIVENLPLPISGIMSDKSVEYVGKKVENIRRALLDQGYNHYNPIMSVGTLGLVVSPHLKLTDKGLVDVAKGKIVDLVIQ